MQRSRSTNGQGGEEVNTSTCKGCGAAIIWALNPSTGKRVPLDAKALVYETWDGKDGPECAPTTADGSEKEHFVSHFLTCPKVNDFSHKKP